MYDIVEKVKEIFFFLVFQAESIAKAIIALPPCNLPFIPVRYWWQPKMSISHFFGNGAPLIT